MSTLASLLMALLMAAAVFALGWRDTAGEADMARAMGLTMPRRRFSLDAWAKSVDAGLTGPQILLAGAVWILGGLVVGLLQGGVWTAVLYALGAGLFYYGTLKQRREARRAERAEYLARALDVVETMLKQGRSLMDALEEAAQASPPVAREVLNDLIARLRAAPGDAAARAVREWDETWDNPAVDMLAAALLAALEGRMELARFIEPLRGSLQDVVDVLRTAQAEAKGIVWQTRFLTFWPPVVLLAMTLFAPGWAAAFRAHPWLLLPALLGSVLTYWLTMGDLRRNLSVDAAVGLAPGGEGEIKLDRMGKPL